MTFCPTAPTSFPQPTSPLPAPYLPYLHCQGSSRPTAMEGDLQKWGMGQHQARRATSSFACDMRVCVYIYIYPYTYAGEVCTTVCASLCMSTAFTGRAYVPCTDFCGVHTCVLWVVNCICAYTCTYMHVSISACMSSRTRQFREQFYFPYKQTLAWKCGP